MDTQIACSRLPDRMNQYGRVDGAEQPASRREYRVRLTSWPPLRESDDEALEQDGVDLREITVAELVV